MTPTEERMKKKAVEAALRRLRPGVLYSRRELFEPSRHYSEQWTARVIQKLVDTGCLAKVQGTDDTGPVMRYRMAHEDRCDDLMNNDVKLAKVIWPGGASDAPPPPGDSEDVPAWARPEPVPMVEATTTSAAVPPRLRVRADLLAQRGLTPVAPEPAAPPVEEPKSATPAPTGDNAELLAGLLKLNMASIQNITWIRDRVKRVDDIVAAQAEISGTLEDQQEAMDELKVHVQTVDAKLDECLQILRKLL